MGIQEAATAALTAIISAHPELAVSVRYVGDVAGLDGTVASAFCAGAERGRAQTEEGLMDGADASFRYLLSSEPTGWAVQSGDNMVAINGQVVEALFSGQTDWKRFRVVSRRDQSGIVRLNVAAEFGTL